MAHHARGSSSPLWLRTGIHGHRSGVSSGSLSSATSLLAAAVDQPSEAAGEDGAGASPVGAAGVAVHGRTSIATYLALKMLSGGKNSHGVTEEAFPSSFRAFRREPVKSSA